MIVTDAKWKNKSGDIKTGFYMDGWLKENLDEILKILKESYDCVGIVSGHGKVRIGKSTMAMHICYYIAWLLAGGKIITEIIKETNRPKILEIIPPTEPIKFS